jgi:chitin disaccharide deacetylase
MPLSGTAVPDAAWEVIVTADDLGCDRQISTAIVRSLTEAYATHASLIVTMPWAEEAVALAHAAHVSNSIGIHLSLTEGRPVTDAIRRLPGYCRDDAFFYSGSQRRLWPLSSEERRIVADELRAQIDSARKGHLTIGHLDSHHHVHLEPRLAPIVWSVCREMGIPRVRPARNCGLSHGAFRTTKATLYNWSLARARLRGVDYFGEAHDLLRLPPERRTAGVRAEMMLHPTTDASGVLIDGPSGQPLDTLIRALRNQDGPPLAHSR